MTRTSIVAHVNQTDEYKGKEMRYIRIHVHIVLLANDETKKTKSLSLWIDGHTVLHAIFFASYTLDATTKLGIPSVFYCACSVCGFMDFYYCKELMERGMIPLKSEDDLTNGYLDTVIYCIPGMIEVRMRDLTSFIRTTNRDDILLNHIIYETHASHQATAIIFNSFSELESPLLNACASMLPPVFDIGPMCLLSQYIPNDSSITSFGRLNLWREGLGCVEWLDEKEPGSVLYANFGSLANLTNCNTPFLHIGDAIYFQTNIKDIINTKQGEDDLTNGYLDTVIDCIPGMIDVRMRDLTSFIRTTNRDDMMLNHFIYETHASHQATAIIFNSFSELESPLLNACSSMLPPVFDIGPMCLLSQYISNDSSVTSFGRLNLWKEDLRCVEWLDEKEPGSVLYVNFGGMTNLTSKQFLEFAWGLANSGCLFLWAIRPDLVVGDTALLPQELSEMTKGRSFITSWCPQQRVLSHAAVGGFLTHCGWNSTTESICAGVPMICWPFFADQQINCRYICSVWGIGMEINEDVKREEVARLIEELMRGQKGKEMKKAAMEWKEKAFEAAKPGGGSWINLERLIKEIITKE